MLPLGLYSTSSVLYLSCWALHILVQLGALCYVAVSIWRHVRLAGSFGLIALVLSLASIVAMALFASLPIIARDALLYHLAVPKLWLAAGAITEIPWHEWSYFPLLLSQGYAGFLNFGLEDVTQYYHLSFLLISAGVLANFLGTQLRSSRSALLGFLFLLSIPLSIKLASQPMADFGAALYFGIAVLTLLRYLEDERRSLLVLAALSLGLCLSTKYSACLAVVLLAGIFLIWAISSQRPMKKVGSEGLVLLFFASLVYLPWPLRNFYWTGNPMYPFLGSVFGGTDGLPFFSGLSPLEHRLLGYEESLLQFLLIPLRMLFFGEDGNPRQFAGVFSPFLLLAVASLSKLPKEHRRMVYVLAALVLSYWYISLFSFYALVRYQVLILLPLIVLACFGIERVSSLLSEQAGKGLQLFLLLAMALYGDWYIFAHAEKLELTEYLGTAQSKESYLSSRISEFETIEYVNAELPADARVYLLFTGNRFYYYERDVRGAYFSAKPIQEYLLSSESKALGVSDVAAALAERFNRDGITHLAIHNRRIHGVLGDSLDKQGKAVWNSFLGEQLQLVHQGRFVGIWKLKVAEPE